MLEIKGNRPSILRFKIDVSGSDEPPVARLVLETDEVNLLFEATVEDDYAVASLPLLEKYFATTTDATAYLEVIVENVYHIPWSGSVVVLIDKKTTPKPEAVVIAPVVDKDDVPIVEIDSDIESSQDGDGSVNKDDEEKDEGYAPPTLDLSESSVPEAEDVQDGPMSIAELKERLTNPNKHKKVYTTPTPRSREQILSELKPMKAVKESGMSKKVDDDNRKGARPLDDGRISRLLEQLSKSDADTKPSNVDTSMASKLFNSMSK